VGWWCDGIECFREKKDWIRSDRGVHLMLIAYISATMSRAKTTYVFMIVEKSGWMAFC
jgi:hypothetical protein